MEEEPKDILQLRILHVGQNRMDEVHKWLEVDYILYISWVTIDDYQLIIITHLEEYSWQPQRDAGRMEENFYIKQFEMKEAIFGVDTELLIIMQHDIFKVVDNAMELRMTSRFDGTGRIHEDIMEA